MGRCGRRVLCAVQAGVGIAFWAISMPAARSTGRRRSRRWIASDAHDAMALSAPRRVPGIAHGRPFQREPMRAMDEAVADGIGDAGFANGGVPRGRRELTGDERRRAFTAIFDHLEQVAPFAHR